MKHQIVILITSVLVGCGIEVGNPKPDTTAGTGGTLKVRMESGEGSGQSLTMQIASLTLVGGDAEEFSYEATPLTETIDLLSEEFTSKSGAIIAEFKNIASGVYSQLSIKLSASDALNFVDASGNDTDISLDDDSDGIINFATDVEVSDASDEELVAIFDPERSIVSPQTSDPKYRFRPTGEAHHARPGLQFVGTTDVENATYACAYIMKKLPPLNERHGRRHTKSFKLHDKNERHTQVKPRPSFADEGVNRTKDSTSSCENAFARVRVVEGEYEFLRLRPGIYDFRVFQKAGDVESYVDQNLGVLVEPHKQGS